MIFFGTGYIFVIHLLIKKLKKQKNTSKVTPIVSVYASIFPAE